MYEDNNYLAHYGVKGMKWGVRKKYPDKLDINKSDSSVTKRVKKDYNSMDDQSFKSKYKASKKTYAKRVEKYGDPYMNSPLAKTGKRLENLNNKRLRNSNKALQKEIDSFKGYENGIRDKKGKLVLSKDDVNSITKSLKDQQTKNKKQIKETYDKTRERIVKEISDYEKKTGKQFSDKFFENYDDIEMWDLYSPDELNFWD